MALPPLFSSTLPRLLPCLVALGSLLLVSCYPYPEDPPYQPARSATPRPAPVAPIVKAPAPTPAPAKIPTLPEKRTSPAAAHPVPPLAVHPTPPAPQSLPASPPAMQKSPATPNPDIPVAAAAPGKAGYVLSPYNHKLILVRGIPSGAILHDPAYPASDNKSFRVP